MWAFKCICEGKSHDNCLRHIRDKRNVAFFFVTNFITTANNE